jgi:hypothetical protein
MHFVAIGFARLREHQLSERREFSRNIRMLEPTSESVTTVKGKNENFLFDKGPAELCRNADFPGADHWHNGR